MLPLLPPLVHNSAKKIVQMHIVERFVFHKAQATKRKYANRGDEKSARKMFTCLLGRSQAGEKNVAKQGI